MGVVVFSRNEELPVVFMFSVVLMPFSYSDNLKGPQFISPQQAQEDTKSFSNKVPMKSLSGFIKSGLRSSNGMLFFSTVINIFLSCSRAKFSLNFYLAPK